MYYISRRIRGHTTYILILVISIILCNQEIWKHFTYLITRVWMVQNKIKCLFRKIFTILICANFLTMITEIIFQNP